MFGSDVCVSIPIEFRLVWFCKVLVNYWYGISYIGALLTGDRVHRAFISVVTQAPENDVDW